MLLRFNSLAPDTTELVISSAFLNTFPILNLTPARVIITEAAPPTATISYSDSINRFADTLILTASFSEPMDPANPVRLSLSGAVTLVEAEMDRLSETLYSYPYEIPKASGEVQVALSHGTDLWGNEVVSSPSAGASFTIIGFMPGDVNDDGNIQAYDAALTLQFSVGIDPLPGLDPLPWEPWRDSTANVDGSAGITANDAGLILQYSAGLIADFPSGSAIPASTAHIDLEIVEEHIVFYSHGQLLGLNIRSSNENGILGPPEVLNEVFMSASNLDKSAYRIGLCTAVPAIDGDAVLKIPVLKSGSVTFHLIENTTEREVTLQLATGLKETPGEGFGIFPNPVADKLCIVGLRASSSLRIYNIHGQELFEKRVEGEVAELDLSELPAGLYLIKIESGEEIICKQFIKQ